jgi:predicted PurR-regulated permease PerM
LLPKTVDSPTGAQLAVQLVFAFAAPTLLVVLLWPFLPALVTASVLAVILMPVYRRLNGRIGRPAVAASITTLLGVLGIVTPLFVVGQGALAQLSWIAEWLAGDGQTALDSLPQLQNTVDLWLGRMGLEGLRIGEAIVTWLQAAPSFLMGRAFGLLAGIGGIAVQAAVATFTLFFLFRDESRVIGFVLSLIPLDNTRTTRLLVRGRDVVAAVAYGNLLVAVVQGTLGGVAFLFVGIPAPAVWGALMATGSLVPMLGPGVIWLPAAVVLILTGSILRGVALMTFGFLVIATLDNVIRSTFVGARAHVHPMVAFLGVLGGIVLFGTVGVFVGPVLLAEILLGLEMFREVLYPDGGTPLSGGPDRRHIADSNASS